MWKRLIRFGFRLLYNELAWTYDFVAWIVSFGQWQAWGRTSLRYLRGKRVLELAHGPGHLLVAMKQAGYEPIGLDLSPTMSKRAARRLRRADVDVPLVRCRVQALPFRSSWFDCVVATFPTDYIVDPNTAHEVARVTHERGRLVVVASAQLTGRGTRTRFVEWLYRITGQRESVLDAAHESIYEQAGMSLRIESATVGRSDVTLLVVDKESVNSSQMG